jgi:hypothetical protein
MKIHGGETSMMQKVIQNERQGQSRSVLFARGCLEKFIVGHLMVALPQAFVYVAAS